MWLMSYDHFNKFSMAGFILGLLLLCSFAYMNIPSTRSNHMPDEMKNKAKDQTANNISSPTSKESSQPTPKIESPPASRGSGFNKRGAKPPIAPVDQHNDDAKPPAKKDK